VVGIDPGLAADPGDVDHDRPGDEAVGRQVGDVGPAGVVDRPPAVPRGVERDVVDRVDVRVGEPVAVDLDVVGPHADGAVGVEDVDVEARPAVAPR
jgi:hypothetical protein